MIHPATAPAADKPCEMYLDHGSARPSVTQGHHIFAVYLQRRLWGEVRLDDVSFICGTCHDNVHAWLYWLMGERSRPDPDPPLRAKAAAQRTLDWYTANT